MLGMDPKSPFMPGNATKEKREKEQLGIPGAHLFCAGNRPSVTLIYPKLTPEILGKLLALFEHRTFVEGLIWNLNSFDQWGVELGKNLSKKLTNAMKGYNSIDTFSGSTIGLVEEINRLKG